MFFAPRTCYTLPLIALALLAAIPATAAPARKTAPRKPAPTPTKPTPAKPTPAKKTGDPAILNHAGYPAFSAILNKQVQDNSPDYYDAIMCVLDATDGDETAVQKWMEAAALGGNVAAARWVIGQKLADIPPDKVMDPDIKAAYQELCKLSDKGFVPAILDVSACLRMGLGVAKDENAAARRMMEACKGGDFLARFQWLLTTKRLATYEDKDKPEIASEVERGNHYVMYRLSGLAPNAAAQLDWMTKAAQKGNREACFAISSLSSASHPKESYAYLSEAVKLHHPEALYVMGSALVEENPTNPYVKEAGITPDPAKGLRLLKAAALLGSPQAAMVLGKAYCDGALGLPKDEAKAYFHYSNPQVAANVMCSTARALMLLTGQGTKQDTQLGWDKLKRSAATGYPGALVAQAYAYYKGLGVKEDARAAADILSEAAATGYPVAYVYLAFLTAKGGPGLPADIPQAKRFVRLASMDLGDKAQQIYDDITLRGEWLLRP